MNVGLSKEHILEALRSVEVDVHSEEKLKEAIASAISINNAEITKQVAQFFDGLSGGAEEYVKSMGAKSQ